MGLAERRLFSRTVSMKVELDEGRSGPQVSAISVLSASAFCSAAGWYIARAGNRGDSP